MTTTTDVSLEGLATNIFEAYEQRMVPAVFAPFAERLVEAAGLRDGERVLDVACGTGAVARAAARRVGPIGSVTALDLVPAFLDVARASSAHVTPAIEWVEASAQEMPLPDAAFDAVLCQQGLQFFPDKVQALREARRVLAPGGRIAVSVWGPIERSPAVAAVQRALERHAPEIAGFFPAIFGLSDAGALAGLLRDAGFRDGDVRPERVTVRFPSIQAYLDTYLGSTPVGGVVASLPAERRAALSSDLGEALRAHLTDDGLAVVMEANVAVATT